MNITVVLVIAIVVIAFLVIEICGVSLLINSIREKDWTLSCVIGFTLIVVCILEILAFITICPELKQDIYTDYQRRERRRAADRFAAAEPHPAGEAPEQARKGPGKAAAHCTRCAGKARSGVRSRSC